MTRTPYRESSLRKPTTWPAGPHSPGPRIGSDPGQPLRYAILEGDTPPTLLTPKHAWTLLCRKTGASLSRTTFYRWLREGRILTVRMGYRLFVPIGALDEFTDRCLAGERS